MIDDSSCLGKENTWCLSSLGDGEVICATGVVR